MPYYNLDNHSCGSKLCASVSKVSILSTINLRAMFKKIIFLFILFVLSCQSKSQIYSRYSNLGDKMVHESNSSYASVPFHSTSDFLDAAINSINTFNSLIKKENYRNKITSFNNPTSSDMGFNLENEIQTALKPLLAKAKSTNVQKFSQVVSALVTTPAKGLSTVSKTAAPAVNPLFTTLLSLVGNLTIQEKKITRDDLDSFITSTQKYFVQYEKLNGANHLFDQNIDRLNQKLSELQFDLKEYMLDMITILYKGVQRGQLKNLNTEELFLKYLDKSKLEEVIEKNKAEGVSFQYPSDGIKSAKDIAYDLQKLFNEYQKVYTENYQQIRAILNESRTLGKNINVKQVEASLKDLETLYNESKTSDVLALRFTTLFERLKTLTGTEQVVKK